MDNSNNSPQTPLAQDAAPVSQESTPKQEAAVSPVSEANTPPQDAPEQKPKKKKKHRFLKFLAAIVLIFGCVRLVTFIKTKHDEKVLDEYLDKVLLVDRSKPELSSEEELNRPSVTEGMTQYEKLREGLSALRADTDEDGLSDYDEINVYHTNPTLYSTSGDIYGDGYKVANSLDLTRNYGDSENISVADGKVTLFADEAFDLEAVYKDYRGSVPNNYVLATQPFRVFSFTGKAFVKIDAPDNYDVISYDNYNKTIEKLDVTAESDGISFDIKDDNPILITYNKKALKKLGGAINSNFDAGGVNVDSEYIVISMPILNALKIVPVTVFIVGSGNAAQLEHELNVRAGGVFEVKVRNINAFAARVLDAVFGWIAGRMTSLTDGNGEMVGSLLNYVHVGSSRELMDYMVGSSEVADSPEPNSSNEEERCDYCADSGFSVSKNAFKFSNLATEASSGGVCAGFAHVTATAYNNDLTRSLDGVYSFDDNMHASIISANLHDYEPQSTELRAYADNLKNEGLVDSTKIGRPDSDVVAALNYYYEDQNDRHNTLRILMILDRARCNSSDVVTGLLFAPAVSGFCIGGSLKESDASYDISEETVQNMKRQFEQGKIVELAFIGITSDGSHAVNAYKMTEDKANDLIYVNIYDNNFADDSYLRRNNERMGAKPVMVLHRKYRKLASGDTTASYEFEYYPVASRAKYRWSNLGADEKDGLIVYDENYVY